MTIWQAIILGLVQGITEFLPVSSSGHLVVARALLGAEAEPLIFEIVVHCGTLLAVLVVFRHDILRMLKNPFGKLVRYLVVATIPAVIFTLLFDNWIESAFGGRFLGIGFILHRHPAHAGRTQTGAPSAQVQPDEVHRCAGNGAAYRPLRWCPAFSRSGSTIVGGLFCGLDRRMAARFLIPDVHPGHSWGLWCLNSKI